MKTVNVMKTIFILKQGFSIVVDCRVLNPHSKLISFTSITTFYVDDGATSITTSEGLFGAV